MLQGDLGQGAGHRVVVVAVVRPHQEAHVRLHLRDHFRHGPLGFHRDVEAM